MTGKRRTDQSQLDYLWDMFGEVFLYDNPLEADNGDILNKKGITTLISNMIKVLVKSVIIKDNEDNNDLLDVISISNDGTHKFLFSLDKENHIEKVVLRKSLEPDVEMGFAKDIGEPVFDFEMKRGNHIVTSLDDIYLEGGVTASINTLVENGKIFSKLRLANSDDPTLNVDVIQNGLLIETILAQPNGQVVLEKTKTGLAVKLEWSDGKPIIMKEMSWAQYSIDDNKDGVIYFLNDKGYILLNGKRYGDIPQDIVRMQPAPIEGFPDRKMLVLNCDDVIIADNGTGKNRASLIKGSKNGTTMIGDSRHPLQLFGSDKLKYNGSDVAFADDLKEGMHDVEISITELTDSVSERFKETDTRIENSVNDEVERVNGVIQTLRSNLTDSIDNIDKKAVKYEDVSTEQNPGRKAVLLENNDLILGKLPNSNESVNLAMVNKWGIADYGSSKLPFNINVPAGKRPTVQEAGQSGEQVNEIAYVSEVEYLKGIIQQLSNDIAELKVLVDELKKPQP